MLELKAEVKRERCRVFKHSQTTGTYSSSNPTGWGIPNYNPSDGHVATLLIKNHKTDIEYDIMNILSGPAVVTEIPFSNLFLNSTPIGTEEIEDGI